MSEIDFSNTLMHYGVKGMKWGVRKDRRTSNKPGYKIKSDGSIVINKGHTIQRTFQTGHNSGQSGSAYFAFTEKDKHTYVQMMGAGVDSRFKIIRKLASDKISTFVAKEKINVPSTKQATDILNDTKRELGIKKKRTDDFERDIQSLVFSKNKSELSTKFKENLQRSGFNAVRDETDSGFLSDHPIVILDGDKSLRLIQIRDLTRSDLTKAKEYIDSTFNK